MDTVNFGKIMNEEQKVPGLPDALSISEVCALLSKKHGIKVWKQSISYYASPSVAVLDANRDANGRLVTIVNNEKLLILYNAGIQQRQKRKK